MNNYSLTLWIVVAIQTVLLFLISTRMNSFVRKNPFEVAAEIPRLNILSISNQKVDVKQMLSQAKPTLIIFTSSRCSICKRLIPQISEWEDFPAEVRLVNLGDAKEAKRFVEMTATTFPVCIIRLKDIANKYKVRTFPFSILADPSGKIMKSGIIMPEDLESWVSFRKKRPIVAM